MQSTQQSISLEGQSYRPVLLEWLKEIIPYSRMEDYLLLTNESELVKGSDIDATVRYLFCTDTHTYSISASPTYLGCIGWSRKYRAGEDWTRGNDLPDGKFSRETWDAIKAGIIRYELVKLEGKPNEMKQAVPDVPSATATEP